MTKSLGWNGTHLSYGTVYFRNNRIGIGDSNPAQSLTSTGNAVFGSTGRSANTFVRALAGDNNQAGFEAYGNNQGTGYLYVGQSVPMVVVLPTTVTTHLVRLTLSKVTISPSSEEATVLTPVS